LKSALSNVPMTNPACTALVNNEATSGGRSTLSRSAGTTADAENHSDMVATAQNAMITRERVRTVNTNPTPKPRES